MVNNKQVSKKDIDIQKVGVILSDIILPLGLSTLRFISSTLRQAELGPQEFGYCIANVLNNDLTIPAASLRGFDWTSAVLGFVAMSLELEDLAGLCYEEKPFKDDVIEKANRILDIKNRPFDPKVKVMRKAFAKNGLMIAFKRDMENGNG